MRPTAASGFVGAMKHCPVPGCRSRIARTLLLCRRHWRRVPPALKREVWRTYKNGEGVFDPDYLRAARAAIEAAGEDFVEERRSA